MGRPRGIAKTGGRQAGTPNRRTVERYLAAADPGLQPREFLTGVMRGEIVPTVDMDTEALAIRMDAAKALLPYVHCRQPVLAPPVSADPKTIEGQVVQFEDFVPKRLQEKSRNE